jgi:TatD DNase family protein
MTDSHCHLDFCQHPERAADPSLALIVTVGTTVERCKAALDLSERFDNVYAAVGIHPNDATEALDPKARGEIEALAEHPKVVAIGETGFDHYWDKVAPEVQRESFYWQAGLAAKLGKPLILHVRDKQNRSSASEEAAMRLREVGYHRGVLHCFNGHPGLLEAGLELSWYVSFAGNLTYKSAKALHDVARALPPDKLLLETDSPFLTPVPKRGQRNVPANVRYTARFLAELRGEVPEATEAYTDANARALYGLDEAPRSTEEIKA